jgi:16S rRNA (uracil1498-N3)-methyltransferase
MRVHRFFIKEPVSQGSIRITEPDLIHQMRDVFRLKKGDNVVLMDGSGCEYRVSIELLTREEGLFNVSQKVENTFEPKVKLNLVCAVTKKTFEWILEKGTELGVSEFTPLISERTEKKDINTERAKRIITESAEQSGKTILPVLNGEVTLKEYIKLIQKNGNVSQTVALHSGGESFQREKVSQYSGGGKTLSILIGPEGGWSDMEIKVFNDAGIPVYSLGTQTLRAETAAVAVAATLLLSV